jgi:glycine cleavage system H protein
MNVDHCDFPDELYYDAENDVWMRQGDGPDKKMVRMGISSTLTFLAGKITLIKFRDVTTVMRGQSLAIVESIKYYGAVRSPVSGRISRFNENLMQEPASLWKAPYDSWIVEFGSIDGDLPDSLLKGEQARAALLSRIKELRIRCFKLLPDEEMYSIGTECTTTLANLDELLVDKPPGYAVHLVTDDPTADIELVRWSMQTGNELVETRKEDNLFHFILKKASTFNTS